ncbi:MAG: hypothetical protein EOO93_31575, partial [Pedobacter sp.]
INIDSYKELASIYFREEKYDSAMIFITNGRVIRPEDPFFSYMEGKILDHLNMKESSLNSFLNSLQLDPTFVESHKELAMIYFRNGNMDEAAKYFNSGKQNEFTQDVFIRALKDDSWPIIYIGLQNFKVESNNAKSDFERVAKLAQAHSNSLVRAEAVKVLKKYFRDKITKEINQDLKADKSLLVKKALRK